MSTRKKKAEAFTYDFGASRPGKVALTATTEDSLEAEQNSKRLLRLQCYMGLEKMHLGVAAELDWYLIQLRLSVCDQMVQLVEKNHRDLAVEDITLLKQVATDGIKGLECISVRIIDGETKEFYTTRDERDAIEIALNLSDELEDLLTEFYGKLAIYKLYRDTKEHLVKMHP